MGKTNSTIQGGFWKSQEQLSERIETSLDEAHEHRKEIIDFIKEKEEAQSQSVHKVNAISINVNEIGNDLEKYQSETMERMKNMMNVLNAIQQGMNDNDKVQKLENEKNALIEKYEAKIVSLEQQVKNLKNELINEQTIKIKEYESKQKYGMKMERIKDEILESMQSEFESLRLANKQKKKSAIDDEKITDLMDKQDDILSKFNSLQKYYKGNKQQYAVIEEAMDSTNTNNERYYNGIVKKMGDNFSKLHASINDIDISMESKTSNESGGNGQNMNRLAAQLTQDMSAANMLSEMRKEVERYRKENEELSLQTNKLKEEAINSREAKRRTVKNLVDEINTMRDQIYKISQGKIKNGQTDF